MTVAEMRLWQFLLSLAGLAVVIIGSLLGLAKWVMQKEVDGLKAENKALEAENRVLGEQVEIAAVTREKQEALAKHWEAMEKKLTEEHRISLEEKDEEKRIAVEALQKEIARLKELQPAAQEYTTVSGNVAQGVYEIENTPFPSGGVAFGHDRSEALEKILDNLNLGGRRGKGQ